MKNEIKYTKNLLQMYEVMDSLGFYPYRKSVDSYYKAKKDSEFYGFEITILSQLEEAHRIIDFSIHLKGVTIHSNFDHVENILHMMNILKEIPKNCGSFVILFDGTDKDMSVFEDVNFRHGNLITTGIPLVYRDKIIVHEPGKKDHDIDYESLLIQYCYHYYYCKEERIKKSKIKDRLSEIEAEKKR